jgi:hypothetical protein
MNRIMLYEATGEDWARIEARLHLENQALKALGMPRQPLLARVFGWLNRPENRVSPRQETRHRATQTS